MHAKKKAKRCCSFRCNVVLKSAICTQRLKKRQPSTVTGYVEKEKEAQRGNKNKTNYRKKKKKKTRAITNGRFTKMGCLNLKNSHARILDEPPNLS